MPTYVPELKGCGSNYPGWYRGEHPTQSGVAHMTYGEHVMPIYGQYCFTTSATASCGSPRAATVLMCEGGFYLYRVIPTASTNYGYCAVFSRKQELLHYVFIMLCFPALPFHVSLPKGSRLGHNVIGARTPRPSNRANDVSDEGVRLLCARLYRCPRNVFVTKKVPLPIS
eukprot:sb/3472264/